MICVEDLSREKLTLEDTKKLDIVVSDQSVLITSCISLAATNPAFLLDSSTTPCSTHQYLLHSPCPLLSKHLLHHQPLSRKSIIVLSKNNTSFADEIVRIRNSQNCIIFISPICKFLSYYFNYVSSLGNIVLGNESLKNVS